MASIQKRPDGRWRARYRDDAGKEHAKHFTRRVDAQRWLDEVTASVITGLYVAPRAGRETFEAYARQWLEVQVFRPTTRELVERNLRVQVFPRIGTMPLKSITRDHVVKLVAELDESYAPTTVEVTYSYVSTILSSAVKSQKIARTPCVDIRMPEKPTKHVVPLSVDEVRRLVEAAPLHIRAQVMLAAGTGMRQGEVLGLTVDRINFLQRKVTVDRQLVTLPNQTPTFGPPKRRASHRVIPLPQVVVDALAAHLAMFGEGPDGLLFTTVSRRPWRRQNHAGEFRKVAKAAGLPGVTFHALRHHYASLLIRHGESVVTVQNRLGHASADETLSTYAHLWPDADDRTREAVDAAYSDLPADSLRTDATS
ncbi:tyrosine-type recombinase/integrase [Mariniluteicoccus flavus]